MPQYLADVAQWIECGLVDQMVTSSIPSWGTCLGCGPGPQWQGGGAQETSTH